jgi:hypothetical protein
MSNRIETYIYESPDGGDTIYRRKFGDAQRELHSISDRKSTLIDDLRKSKLWGSIHRSAQSDPVLKDMLDQVEIYHTLKNSPQDR